MCEFYADWLVGFLEEKGEEKGGTNNNNREKKEKKRDKEERKGKINIIPTTVVSEVDFNPSSNIAEGSFNLLNKVCPTCRCNLQFTLFNSMRGR